MSELADKKMSQTKLTPKENYFRMLRGEIPEWLPSYFNNGAALWVEELLTPQAAPDGPIVTTLGVTYVGSPDNNWGAMPKPNEVVLDYDNIEHWRDYVKIADLSDFDFESYYREKAKDIDRSQFYIHSGGADYFLSLVSLMGFEATLLALYEYPDEVKEMLEFLSEFYLFIFNQQIKYLKPEILMTMDDDSTWNSPFFSLEMYREFFKPYHKKHYDIALDHEMYIEHHDCGKCEIFIPDWIEMGVQSWNPAQVCNDLVGIKKQYGDKLAIVGGWDNVKYDTCDDEEELRAALKEYVDTFAPGGRFGFFAVTGGLPEEESTKRRMQIVEDFYYEYAFDWYETH